MTISERYNTEKAKNPERLLLMRLGDFYEAFGEDAVKLAAVLDEGKKYKYSLTKRNGIQMAGVPYHSLHAYILKLRCAGHIINIVEAN